MMRMVVMMLRMMMMIVIIMMTIFTISTVFDCQPINENWFGVKIDLILN